MSEAEKPQEHVAPPADPPSPPPTKIIVPRWIQLVTLPLAALGAWALLRASGVVLLLFVIAALFALLLNPFVSRLRRTGLPRGLSVLIVFLGLITVVIGLGALLADPIADQVSAIQRDVPDYVDDANAAVEDLQSFFDDNGIDVQILQQGRTAVQTLGDRLAEGSGEVVSFTRAALTKVVEASFALILIIVLTVYLLLYGERIGAAVRAFMPHDKGEDDFPLRAQKAVFGYIRGQLLFSLIMGTSAGVMLFVLGSLGIFPDGKQYALVFGAFFGFAELIPYVGPVIGAAPPVFAALLGSDPVDALWLSLAFLALQQLEGHVVAPNVFAQVLRINPIVVILALLTGAQLYGIVGAFVALPIAALVRETALYARRHLVLEPWPAAAVAGVGTGIEVSGPTRCPECGSRVHEGDVVCTSCGTELPDDAARSAATSSAPG
jgi:predicted PurR-regulated permease PerM